jgi:hypothetical protein
MAVLVLADLPHLMQAHLQAVKTPQHLDLQQLVEDVADLGMADQLFQKQLELQALAVLVEVNRIHLTQIDLAVLVQQVKATEAATVLLTHQVLKWVQVVAVELEALD